MDRRSNAGFFERLRGPSSVSYKGELQRRRTKARKESRLEAARQREAEREEIRRERQVVREANKVKRQMLAEERREEQKRRKEEEREAPHKAMPSAAAIKRAYERGARSLSEAMQMARSNPKGTKGRFDRCVQAVSERGGAYDPRAVCGAQEKKYRKNPRRTIAGVEFSLGNDGVVVWSDNWEQLTRWAEKRQHGFRFRAGGPETYGHTDIVHNPGEGREVRVYPSERFKGKWSVARVGGVVETRKSKRGAISWGKRMMRPGDTLVVRDNPADSAVEAYKIFHGREPEELITIAKQRHYHKHLAAAGELEKLVIEYPVGNGRKLQPISLTKFKGALLAFNEQALPELARNGKVKLTQLFIEGGDQSVNLEDFGIDPENVHEIETLGKAVKIDYFTTKDHLGGEGGTAVYGHKFRSTNRDGKHVTVKIAKYPDVIYRVRDNQLEFSGGSYEIRAEGIDK